MSFHCDIDCDVPGSLVHCNSGLGVLTVYLSVGINRLKRALVTYSGFKVAGLGSQGI